MKELDLDIEKYKSRRTKDTNFSKLEEAYKELKKRIK